MPPMQAPTPFVREAGDAALPRFGLPKRLDPLEGWIASVPVE